MVADAKLCCIFNEPYCSRLWAWSTRHGSISTAHPAKICILSMDLPDHQHHCSCVPQVVGLRMASGARFLQNLPGHCVAFNPNGHELRLPSTRFDLVRLHTVASQLGLFIPAEEMLGGGKSASLIHTGDIEHHHGCCVHGCTYHLPIKGTAVQENAAGHPHRVSTNHTVSLLFFLSLR